MKTRPHRMSQPPTADGLEIGTIARITEGKGYGFIKRADGPDVFFHASSVRGPALFETLKVGDKVTFRVTTAEKGPRAEDVERTTS